MMEMSQPDDDDEVVDDVQDKNWRCVKLVEAEKMSQYQNQSSLLDHYYVMM